MSKARPSIPENLKVALLRETNYRCGYCMMNITPAAYFTENRDKTDERVKKFVEDFNQKNKLAAEGSASILTIAEVNDLLPTYYQSYDCAHIEPYNEEDPETNSLLNLIALCKSCHWKSEPQHNNAIIPKEQLKALKLHWMIASGRFTRLEIDVLMGLYNALILCRSDNIKVYCPSYICLRAFDEDDRPTTSTLLPNGERPRITPVVPIQRPTILLFQNIVNQNFVATLPQMPYDMLNERVLNYMPDTDIIFNTYDLVLSEPGAKFCQKFHEAYQELDKIETQC